MIIPTINPSEAEKICSRIDKVRYFLIDTQIEYLKGSTEFNNFLAEMIGLLGNIRFKIKFSEKLNRRQKNKKGSQIYKIIGWQA